MRVRQELSKLLKKHPIKVYPTIKAKKQLWRYSRNKPASGLWIGLSDCLSAIWVIPKGRKTASCYYRGFWKTKAGEK